MVRRFLIPLLLFPVIAWGQIFSEFCNPAIDPPYTLGSRISTYKIPIETACGWGPPMRDNFIYEEAHGCYDDFPCTAIARVNTSVNSSAIGTRRGLNFIEGTGIDIAGVDNSGSERVDITISLESTTTTTAATTTTTTTVTTTTVTTTTLPGVAGPTNVILPYNTNSVFTGGTTTNAAMGANATLCGTFTPHFRLSPTKVAFRVQNTVAGATCGCALYTVSGTTLSITTVTTGAIACATAGLKSTTGLTPVTLLPGTKYAYCCSQSATTQQWLVSAAYSDSTAAEQIMNAYTTNLGSGTASVGGAPPSSVTLSALGVQIPIVNFSEE